MSEVRYTKEGQDRRSERLEAMRKRLKSIKRLEELRSSPEWRDLKSVLEDFVQVEKNAERLAVQACEAGGHWDAASREFHQKQPHDLISDLRLALKGQRDYQLVIDLVEKTEAQVSHLNGEIERIEEQYRTAKDQLESVGG